MKNQLSRRNFLTQLASVSLAPALSSFPAAGKTINSPPNILWIAVEDISPFIGCYNFDIDTPDIDSLAGNGVVFSNAFMPAPVCSACRSGLITGVMPTTIGVHNHHASRTEETAIHLPPGLQTLPELFREKGYFTFNQGKDDYNFWYNREDLYSGTYVTHPLYGKSGDRVTGWQQAAKGQPFFGQIQLYGNKHIYGKSFKEKVSQPVDRNSFSLPPYYPDNPAIREDWGQHLDCIKITDEEVGLIMQNLEKDNLLDNTIIFFFSDHGMRLWRHKQFLYDTGVQVPFIIRFPGSSGPRGVRNDLISGLDITATSLALAGLEVPSYMESRNLFASDYRQREYVVSVRDRCDYTIDRIRSVRTKKFRYIRNFFPDRPYMQPNYRDEWEITTLMRELHLQGKLDPVQDRFWGDDRPSEELYDIENDPHSINNLWLDPEYREVLLQHRQYLTEWICATGDQGQYPEDSGNLKYIYDFWINKGVEPVNPEYNQFKKQR